MITVSEMNKEIKVPEALLVDDDGQGSVEIMKSGSIEDIEKYFENIKNLDDMYYGVLNESMSVYVLKRTKVIKLVSNPQIQVVEVEKAKPVE